MDDAFFREEAPPAMETPSDAAEGVSDAIGATVGHLGFKLLTFRTGEFGGGHAVCS